MNDEDATSRRSQLVGLMVRSSIGPEDEKWAAPARDLIEQASKEAEIATRELSFLIEKLVAGLAALAIVTNEGVSTLIGFGFVSVWENEFRTERLPAPKFQTHGGLVVHPSYRKHQIGRDLKMVLMQISGAKYPTFPIVSLTTNPGVEHMNLGLKFRRTPLKDLPCSRAFQQGCTGCHLYQQVQLDEEAEQLPTGHRCCCRGLLLVPNAPPTA